MSANLNKFSKSKTMDTTCNYHQSAMQEHRILITMSRAPSLSHDAVVRRGVWNESVDSLKDCICFTTQSRFHANSIDMLALKPVPDLPTASSPNDTLIRAINLAPAWSHYTRTLALTYDCRRYKNTA
ncbi:hypothetical protein CHS0354_007117 [Potamilus streckersoni]|uniref:Uncharacterized protein n=1 Tax=Potamilus streckersoni TaxID=2493646 RepID=A0AAE0W506_9BIVA|nr:hypothetical protein CHS0354_007117 [Potamilus streckersoni]